MTDQASQSAPSDAATAFEELRREVSLARAAVEGLTAARERIPDYSETLAAMLAALRDAADHGRRQSGSRDQQHDQRSTPAVANGMKFGIQPAFGASDTSGNTLHSHSNDALHRRNLGLLRPFLRRLAAVRCAFRWVASIITVSVATLAPASVAKIRSRTPIRLQRMKRL